MRIGELSARTGCSIPNIRFYEDKGLIESVRTRSGYRLFDEQALHTLQFIVQCRANGMKLSCIRTLLEAERNPGQSPEDICERIDRFLAEADAQIELMRGLKEHLLRLRKQFH